MEIAELSRARIARIETVPLKVKLERAAVGSALKLTHQWIVTAARAGDHVPGLDRALFR